MTEVTFKKKLRKYFYWVLLINFLLASGHSDSIDAMVSMDSVKALIETGTPSLPWQQPYSRTLLARGKHGWFSKLGITHMIVYAPAVMLGKTMGYFRGNENRWIEFFASFTNPIFHAFLFFFVALIVWRITASSGFALLASITTCYSTLLFPYMKTLHREVLQALLFAMLFEVVTNEVRSLKRKFFYAGTILSALLLMKQALVLVAFPIILQLLLSERRKDVRSKLFGLIPIVFSVTALIVYWKWVAGTPSTLGYGPKVLSLNDARAWSTPFWEGVYVQCLSMKKGLLWYSPSLLIGVVGFVLGLIRRQIHGLEWCALTVILGQVAMHAKWFDATGLGPLGPRYLVAVIPLFVFMSARSLAVARHNLNRLFTAIAAFLIFSSFVIQVPWMVVKPQIYQAIQEKAESIPAKQFEPQWIAGFRLLSKNVSGEPAIFSTSMFSKFAPPQTIDLSMNESFRGINVWWAHAFRGEVQY